MTHAAIIEKIGPAVIAERMNRPRSHVRVWKHRGIPRALFADFITAFPDDVSLDALKRGCPRPDGMKEAA